MVFSGFAEENMNIGSGVLAPRSGGGRKPPALDQETEGNLRLKSSLPLGQKPYSGAAGATAVMN